MLAETSLRGRHGTHPHMWEHACAHLQAPCCVNNDCIIVLSSRLCKPLLCNLCRLLVHSHLKHRHLRHHFNT